MTRRPLLTAVSSPGPANLALFATSVAAELCGLHPQTLRSYERRGLLTPARTAGGTRRYSSADLMLARRISELSALGISLEGIELVLTLEEELVELRLKIADLQAQFGSAAGPAPGV